MDIVLSSTHTKKRRQKIFFKKIEKFFKNPLTTHTMRGTMKPSRGDTPQKRKEKRNMKNYTLVKVHYTNPSEHAKSIGIKAGEVIASFIYRTDSHALALHQCGKDNPTYTTENGIVLEALHFDVDDERNQELYRIHEECGQVFGVTGW